MRVSHQELKTTPTAQCQPAFESASSLPARARKQAAIREDRSACLCARLPRCGQVSARRQAPEPYFGETLSDSDVLCQDPRLVEKVPDAICARNRRAEGY